MPLSIPQLLTKITHTIDFYKKHIKPKKDTFNIFNVLKLRSDEVRLHSAFIGEFLNPQGTHGQGDIYLNLFLKQLGIVGFNSKTTQVFIEKYIGAVNLEGSSGGRIDILLSDENKKNIIIENKIYAADQEKQLLRYHNFDVNANILYLTLEGEDPSKESLGKKRIQYNNISYRHHIIEWLESCLKESACLPAIRETIIQYINLIKELTNQTGELNMASEIKDSILKSDFEAIDQFHQTLTNMIHEKFTDYNNIITEFISAINENEFKDLGIRITKQEEANGICISYELVPKIQGQKPPSTLHNQYRDIFKNHCREDNSTNGHKDSGLFGWIYIKENKFIELSKVEILELFEEEKFKSFISEIKSKIISINKNLVLGINQSNLADKTTAECT